MYRQNISINTVKYYELVLLHFATVKSSYRASGRYRYSSDYTRSRSVWPRFPPPLRKQEGGGSELKLTGRQDKLLPRQRDPRTLTTPGPAYRSSLRRLSPRPELVNPRPRLPPRLRKVISTLRSLFRLRTTLPGPGLHYGSTSTGSLEDRTVPSKATSPSGLSRHSRTLLSTTVSLRALWPTLTTTFPSCLTGRRA